MLPRETSEEVAFAVRVGAIAVVISSAKQFFVRNDAARCDQCLNRVPRRRICPVYRSASRMRAAAVKEVRKDFRKFLGGDDAAD